MKSLLIAFTLAGAVFAGIVFAGVDFAHGQGYYQNGVRRNPLTGELEIVHYGQGYNRWVSPAGQQRGFFGATINPFDGTVMQTMVQRNPVTGHLDVLNQEFNPWTGASVGSDTFYNPFTKRYETRSDVVPPVSIFPPSEATTASDPAGSTEGRPADGAPTSVEKPKRELPRVIETNPLLLKPIKPAAKDVTP